MLPPGQIARSDFPRFGLDQYAERFPARPDDPGLTVSVLSSGPFAIDDALNGLPRTALTTDFHCVTTWSHQGLQWGGVRFVDFFEQHVLPRVPAPDSIAGVVLRSQDGYRTTLLRDDMLAHDVMIADTLNGKPLSVAHGAPLRLVAPRLYGYKSLKHLTRIEFCADQPVTKHGLLAFLDHPRARVEFEERGRWLPGWFLRRLYRPFISGTVKKFEAGLRKSQLNGRD